MEIIKEEKNSKKQQPKMTMKIVGLKILIMAVLQIKNFFKKKEKKTQIILSLMKKPMKLKAVKAKELKILC